VLRQIFGTKPTSGGGGGGVGGGGGKTKFSK